MKMNRSLTRWVVFGIVLLSLSAASFGQVFVSVRIGPPALPVYAQPICPGPGYFWTPGYWAWNDAGGYYWVPGTWVVAPAGMLWTPGYWGWGGGLYHWHAGYWGPHVGFYGGINYGYGYGGEGFYGGEWRGRNFYYNRAVTNVTVTNVTNVYNRTVIVNRTNNVSYNGGTGGIQRHPLPQELRAEHEHHEAPLAMQVQHQHLASENRQNFARENHGRPAIAATGRAGDFGGHSVIPARAAGGEYHTPTMSPREARGPSTPGNRPFTPEKSNNNHPIERTPNPPARGNATGGDRPFTPPNTNHPGNNGTPNNVPNRNTGVNPTYQEHGSSGSNPTHEANRSERPVTPNPPAPHTSQPTPPRHENAAPARRENQPPPRRENPPKGEHNKGR